MMTNRGKNLAAHKMLFRLDVSLRTSIILLSAIFLGAASVSPAQASLIYLYDFPGTPGSGLAADQTNPQPSGATLSDFTRTNLNPDTILRPSEFDTIGWAHNGQDTTQYEGFTITAGAGNLLDLSSLTLNAFQYASGATQGQIALFLNGSTTTYATQSFHWDVNGQVSFTFTPLTDADNVTSAEFRIYGWTAGSPNGADGIDSVAVFGTISSVVPEPATFAPMLFVVSCAIVATKFRR